MDMKKKLLISASVATVSSLAVLVTAAVGARNNETFKVARSEEKTRTIYMNKDTLITRQCYRDDGVFISSYGFFQLENPGSYTAFMSATYFSSTIGGNHLYETPTFTSTGKGVGFAIDIHGLSDDNYYFDSGKQQKINYPGFNNITQIEFVLAKENTSRIDEDRITGYNKSTLTHEEDSKTYTITNIPRNINTYYITYNTTNDDIGKKLVIDEVRISYVC